eukprot:Hpha_TRINITY_DN4518_c0_g1::TRINITY_DN4518_c0_g1_i1::g.115398::m.115398
MGKKSAGGSFAAELKDLLSPVVDKDEDELGGVASDEDADNLRAEIASAQAKQRPGKARLRMRARLDPTFSTGAYSGRVVSKDKLFGGDLSSQDEAGEDEEEEI